MSFNNVLIVGMGGFLGSISRYGTVWLIDKKLDAAYPYGTFTVNIIGSFILGIVIATSWKGGLQDNWRLFLATGFCGGFTTFSAFALENYNMLSQKDYFISFGYIALSLILGIVSIGAGFILGRQL